MVGVLVEASAKSLEGLMVASLSSTLTKRRIAPIVVARKLVPAALAPNLEFSGRHPPIQVNLAKIIEHAAEKTQYGQFVCKTPKSSVMRKIEKVPMAVVTVVRATRFPESSSSLLTRGNRAKAATVAYAKNPMAQRGN